MRKKTKGAVVAGVIVGAVAWAGTSSASAAAIYNGGNYSATAPATRIVVGTTIALNCSASSGAVIMTNGSYTPPAHIGTLVPFLNLCTGPVGMPATIDCAGVPGMLRITGNPASGVTPITVHSLRCHVSFPIAGCSATISGSASSTYTNPYFSTNGKLTVFTAGQIMTTSASTCPAALLPNGAPASIGAQSGSGLGLANLTYSLTSSGPVIL